jgi:hypothetical protein
MFIDVCLINVNKRNKNMESPRCFCFRMFRETARNKFFRRLKRASCCFLFWGSRSSSRFRLPERQGRDRFFLLFLFFYYSTIEMASLGKQQSFAVDDSLVALRQSVINVEGRPANYDPSGYRKMAANSQTMRSPGLNEIKPTSPMVDDSSFIKLSLNNQTMQWSPESLVLRDALKKISSPTPAPASPQFSLSSPLMSLPPDGDAFLLRKSRSNPETPKIYSSSPQPTLLPGTAFSNSPQPFLSSFSSGGSHPPRALGKGGKRSAIPVGHILKVAEKNQLNAQNLPSPKPSPISSPRLSPRISSPRSSPRVSPSIGGNARTRLGLTLAIQGARIAMDFV